MAAFAVVAACAWLGVARSQTGDTRLDAPPTAEFHFARLVYRNSPYSRRGGGFGRGGTARGRPDYADAEFHVMQGIGRFTVVDSASVDIDGNGGRLIQLDRRTRVRLSVAVRGRGRPVVPRRRRSRAAARVSRSRRVPDGRRLLGRVRVGDLHGLDAARIPRSPHRGARRGPRAIARALRLGSTHADSGASAASAPAPCRIGAASSTTTAA